MGPPSRAVISLQAAELMNLPVERSSALSVTWPIFAGEALRGIRVRIE